MKAIVENGRSNENGKQSETPVAPKGNRQRKGNKLATEKQNKAKAFESALAALKSYTISARNRQGQKLALNAAFVAPAGGPIPFESKSGWDYAMLFPFKPANKEAREAAQVTYGELKTMYARLAQKAASETKPSEATRYSAKHLARGANKGKYRVSAGFVTKGGSVVEQLAQARVLASAARDARDA